MPMDRTRTYRFLLPLRSAIRFRIRAPTKPKPDTLSYCNANTNGAAVDDANNWANRRAYTAAAGDRTALPVHA
jgi:hypothetical protein